MAEEYLMHYGVLGMKWGVRRYQNKDGTLKHPKRKKKSQYEINAKALIPGRKAVHQIQKSALKGAKSKNGVDLVKNAAIGVGAIAIGAVAYRNRQYISGAMESMAGVAYRVLKNEGTPNGAKVVNGLYYGGKALAVIGTYKFGKQVVKSQARWAGSMIGTANARAMRDIGKGDQIEKRNKNIDKKIEQIDYSDKLIRKRKTKYRSKS